MPRGRTASDGDVRVAQNGYVYIRCNGRGWVLKHWLVAEEKLGRRIEDDEQVFFKDRDKTNFAPSNIGVRRKKTASMEKQVALIEDKIRELIARRDNLLKQIKRIKEGKLKSQTPS